MKERRFDAEILEGHKDLAALVPFDPKEEWNVQPVRLRPGRNGYRVAGRVNGVEFESSIVPRASAFWLEIPQNLVRRAKLRIGDVASFAIVPPPS